MNVAQIIKATSPMFDLQPPPVLRVQNPLQGWVLGNCSSSTPLAGRVETPAFCSFSGFNTTMNSGTFYFTTGALPVVRYAPFRGGDSLLVLVQ
jgi:hypothetical protein